MTPNRDEMPAAARLAHRGRHRLAPALALMLAVGLAGCSTMPLSGPTATGIGHEARDHAPPFMLVPVDRIVLTALNAAVADDFAPLATVAPAPELTIHVGDMVSVTLWEFGSGLLGPAPAYGGAPGLVGAQSATVPTQTVDQTGLIIVPFAGDIRAAGRTPRQVQAAIVAALRGKSNEAQSLVQIVQTTDNTVTVTGDVNHPGRFPLATNGTRLLDAVSVAGGSTGKARDTLIQLSRGGAIRSLRLSTVLGDPAQNIYLRPDDLITLDHEPQSVVVLGATNKQTEVPFGKTRFTLAEALGNAAGFNDRQADPYGVYVLRYERVNVARNLRSEPLPDYLILGDTAPVIYQVNMRTADGLLLAQNFRMQDHDLIYVANAQSVQVSKLAMLLGQISSIFKNGSVNSYSY